MSEKGGGWVKNLKKWVTLFMDGLAAYLFVVGFMSILNRNFGMKKK